MGVCGKWCNEGRVTYSVIFLVKINWILSFGLRMCYCMLLSRPSVLLSLLVMKNNALHGKQSNRAPFLTGGRESCRSISNIRTFPFILESKSKHFHESFARWTMQRLVVVLLLKLELSYSSTYVLFSPLSVRDHGIRKIPIEERARHWPSVYRLYTTSTKGTECFQGQLTPSIVHDIKW
jgi:hypothetical protein